MFNVFLDGEPVDVLRLKELGVNVYGRGGFVFLDTVRPYPAITLVIEGVNYTPRPGAMLRFEGRCCGTLYHNRPTNSYYRLIERLYGIVLSQYCGGHTFALSTFGANDEFDLEPAETEAVETARLDRIVAAVGLGE